MLECDSTQLPDSNFPYNPQAAQSKALFITTEVDFDEWFSKCKYYMTPILNNEFCTKNKNNLFIIHINIRSVQKIYKN